MKTDIKIHFVMEASILFLTALTYNETSALFWAVASLTIVDIFIYIDIYRRMK